MIRILNSAAPDFSPQLEALTYFEHTYNEAHEQHVRRIIDQVKRQGDDALIELSNRYDRRTLVKASDFCLSTTDFAAAAQQLSPQHYATLQQAAERIRRFHGQQIERDWSITDEWGNELGLRASALSRVGVYVPGGKAAYPSSVLMNAIPAKIAGVAEIIMVVPAPDDLLNPLVLAAAHFAGVDRAFTLGGAQAIAALAYGTASVPRVDKIVGPGNAWVASAKRQVFGQVGIDMIAGPSEVLVISDGSADPEWIAYDLFAQAEHDEQAQSILLTPDAAHLHAVHESMKRLLDTMPRSAIIRTALAERGALIQVPNLAQACAIANRIAPEHLQLAVDNAETYLADITHAGAIFVGVYASETFGDYCAGANHVLPTSGSARFASPLGVYDFIKRTSIVSICPQGAKALAEIAIPLAEAESLHAHAESARKRLDVTTKQ